MRFELIEGPFSEGFIPFVVLFAEDIAADAGGVATRFGDVVLAGIGEGVPDAVAREDDLLGRLVGPCSTK